MKLLKDKIVIGIYKTYHPGVFLLFGQLYSGYIGFTLNLKWFQVMFWIYKPADKFPKLKLWGIGI